MCHQFSSQLFLWHYCRSEILWNKWRVIKEIFQLWHFFPFFIRFNAHSIILFCNHVRFLQFSTQKNFTKIRETLKLTFFYVASLHLSLFFNPKMFLMGDFFIFMPVNYFRGDVKGFNEGTKSTMRLLNCQHNKDLLLHFLVCNRSFFYWRWCSEGNCRWLGFENENNQKCGFWSFNN